MPAASKKLDEAELEALKGAVDAFQLEAGRKLIQAPEVQNIIRIVEEFIKNRRLICYGGTAINNILPPDAQFYKKDSEFPDYDFFSPKAYDDAIALADIYAKEGYKQVEAKSGVHHGTYKVYVNYIPVADITQLAPELFRALGKDDALQIVNGIRYSPPNYLRMAMYLELSRPQGDISRWDKVIRRLALLNKYFPLKTKKCSTSGFMRKFEDQKHEKDVFTIIKDSAVEQGLVFFGGYAASMYSKYMSKAQKKALSKSPDFDMLAEEPRNAAYGIRDRLEAKGLKEVRVLKKAGIGEIIAPHYEIKIGEDIVCFIYKPLACHSYNSIKVGKQTIKVATIDTMLSFYLAFLYANRIYYDHERLLCMAEYLFSVQTKNRFAQKGVLKRWTPECYGTQSTMTDMRIEKSEAFERLKNKRGSKEWNEWFMNYSPHTAKKSSSKTKGTRRKHPVRRNSSARGSSTTHRSPSARGSSSTRRSPSTRGSSTTRRSSSARGSSTTRRSYT